MRTIGVITTSRADYGIYLPILKAIKAHPQLRLRLYVTGSHLSPLAGMTVRAIEQDGFVIAGRVKLTDKDTPVDIAHGMADAINGFSQIYKRNRLDILVTLGDRFEMHAAALAAVPFNIPIAHLHGGELTQGSFDEYFRHSLSKLSHLHFASTDTYAKRIIQMGEEPWRVTVSGAPSLDNLATVSLMTKEQLAKNFKIDLSKPILLTTFHPVTLEKEHTAAYAASLMEALASFPQCHIIFTAPNRDTAGSVMLKVMKQFMTKYQNVSYVSNFGTIGYLSLMREAKVMVGNSSSGIIEAASFRLPVVNIGSRQLGRVMAKNVINSDYTTSAIKKAIQQGLSENFRLSLKTLKNPYGDGQASARIVKALAAVNLDSLIPKKFYDIRSEK